MKFLKKSIKEIPDEKLMQLVLKRDRYAFEELVERHLAPVFRLSYSLLNDTGKAEDIAQETFVKLWEQGDKWQPTSQLRSWLFRIARNMSIDEIRSGKDHVDITKVHLDDHQKSPHSKAFDKQLAAIINAHMRDLPDRQREAITLVHFLECSNIEAAEIMDISIDALESLLARGRSKLKSTLQAYKDSFLREGQDE